jgi:hypothetical protein
MRRLPDGRIGSVRLFDWHNNLPLRFPRSAQIRLRLKTNFANPFSPITLSSPSCKNILLSFYQKMMFN